MSDQTTNAHRQGKMDIHHTENATTHIAETHEIPKENRAKEQRR